MGNPATSFYNWYSNTLRNTKYRWLIVLGTLAYLISPIDIAPDFIPIIGWIDDGVLAALLVAELSQLLLGVLNQKGRKSTAVGDGELEEPVIDVKPH